MTATNFQGKKEDQLVLLSVDNFRSPDGMIQITDVLNIWTVDRGNLLTRPHHLSPAWAGGTFIRVGYTWVGSTWVGSTWVGSTSAGWGPLGWVPRG